MNFKRLIVSVLISAFCLMFQTSPFAATSTKWKTCVTYKNEVATANIYMSVDDTGAAPFDCDNVPAGYKEFVIKGVGYEPVPIGVNPDWTRHLTDFYWDEVENDPLSSASDGKTQNYEFLWKKDGKTWNNDPYRGDLDRIRKELGCNAIRVWGMTSMLAPVEQINGTWQPVYDLSHSDIVTITHQSFLNECDRLGIYVMVGLYLDANFWTKEYYNDASRKKIIDWWDKSYKEVVSEVGAHPAVMGFIVLNEVSDNFGNQTAEEKAFFWSQMKTISKEIKKRAPDKLVGTAFHNFPDTLLDIENYMADCPDVDFWGYNVYGVTSLDLHQFMEVKPSDGNPSIGYQAFANKYSDAAKPVIFTEWGQPVTTHTDSGTSREARLTITDKPLDDDHNVSNAVAQMIKDWGADLYAKKYPIFGGGFYFEFCDEWNKNKDDNTWTNRYFYWYGGTPDTGRPGRYDDEEAFGIYGLKAHAKHSSIPWDTWIAWDTWYGPSYLYDQLVLGVDEENVRKPVRDALAGIYAVNFNDSVLSSALSEIHNKQKIAMNEYNALHNSIAQHMPSCLTFDNDLSLIIPCLQYSGVAYEFTLDYYENPDDPLGHYWKMDASTLKQTSGNNCIALGSDLSISIPCATYSSIQYKIDLIYYYNPLDPSGLYWKLGSGSLQYALSGELNVP